MRLVTQMRRRPWIYSAPHCSSGKARRSEIALTPTAFAPKLEAAKPEQRAKLVDAMLKAVAYHRVGNRPGRWEPRARKRRPKPGARLMQPRRDAKLARNRAKWY